MVLSRFCHPTPPLAKTGKYSVTWKVHAGALGELSVTKSSFLTIAAPVAVRVPILMYHNVQAVSTEPYTVATSMLQRQLQALEAYGYTAVTLQDVMNYRAGNGDRAGQARGSHFRRCLRKPADQRLPRAVQSRHPVQGNRFCAHRPGAGRHGPW